MGAHAVAQVFSLARPAQPHLHARPPPIRPVPIPRPPRPHLTPRPTLPVRRWSASAAGRGLLLRGRLYYRKGKLAIRLHTWCVQVCECRGLQILRRRGAVAATLRRILRGWMCFYSSADLAQVRRFRESSVQQRGAFMYAQLLDRAKTRRFVWAWRTGAQEEVRRRQRRVATCRHMESYALKRLWMRTVTRVGFEPARSQRCTPEPSPLSVPR